MKAAVVLGAGRPPVYQDFSEPTPFGDERLVSIAAAAISPLVRGRASGSHYSSNGAFPFVAGVDGVGRLADGSRVYFFLPKAPFGAMAERTVVPAAQCLPLPAELDDVTAAAIANPGMSSWAAYTLRAKLRAGETVLVNGATGTSGRLAVQIAKLLGANKVVATGRNADALKSLGADVTILLAADQPTLENSFREQFADGVDVVVDYLWGASAQTLLIAAAKSIESRPLRFVQIGSSSGSEIALPSAVLRSAPIELMGSGLGSASQDGLLSAISGVLHAAATQGLTLATRTFALSDLERAWSLDDSAARTVILPQA